MKELFTPLPGILVQKTLTNVESVIYTVPLKNRAYIHAFNMCNLQNATHTASLALCPLGVVNHPNDWVFFDTNVSGNEVKFTIVDFVMNPSDTIRALADGNGDITVTIFGYLI